MFNTDKIVFLNSFDPRSAESMDVTLKVQRTLVQTIPTFLRHLCSPCITEDLVLSYILHQALANFTCPIQNILSFECHPISVSFTLFYPWSTKPMVENM